MQGLEVLLGSHDAGGPVTSLLAQLPHPRPCLVSWSSPPLLSPTSVQTWGYWKTNIRATAVRYLALAKHAALSHSALHGW